MSRRAIREALTQAMLGATPAGQNVAVYTAEQSHGFADLPVLTINPANQNTDLVAGNYFKRSAVFVITGIVAGLNDCQGAAFADKVDAMEEAIVQAFNCFRFEECNKRTIEKIEYVWSDGGQQSTAGVRVYVRFEYDLPALEYRAP